MPAVAGRTTEARSGVTIGTTSSSTTFTCAAGVVSSDDVGRTVTGTGIPAGATFATVNAAFTGGTLSAAATATGSPSVAIGAGDPAVTGYRGWSPESPLEAGTYTVAAFIAGKVPPDRKTDTATGPDRRSRG